jgi:hypothetical protein
VPESAVDVALGRGQLRRTVASPFDQIGMPQRVVADFVPCSARYFSFREEPGGLIEEPVGRTRAGQHVESRGMAKLRMVPAKLSRMPIAHSGSMM